MTDSQKWLLLVFLLVIGWLINLLAPILMPFVFATMLAYLGDPLVDKLEAVKIKNYRLGRTNAVVVVFIIMLTTISAGLFFIIPKIEFQISQFLSNFPDYVLWLNGTVIPWVELNLGIEISLIEGDKIIAVIKSHWQKAGQSALSLMGLVSHSGAVLAAWMMNLLLIPVISFYLLRDWDVLVKKFMIYCLVESLLRQKNWLVRQILS